MDIILSLYVREASLFTFNKYQRSLDIGRIKLTEHTKRSKQNSSLSIKYQVPQGKSNYSRSYKKC